MLYACVVAEIWIIGCVSQVEIYVKFVDLELFPSYDV
jgi:hypothetical protein